MSDRRAYTPEQKTEALQLYVDHGPAEASRSTGIPAKTIASWAGRSGMQTDAASNTEHATRTAAASIATRKAALAQALLDDIDMLRGRMRAAHIERKIVTLSGGLHDQGTWKVAEVEHPSIPTGDLKALVTSVAILVDKVNVLAPTDSLPSAGDSDTEVDDVAEVALRLIAGGG